MIDLGRVDELEQEEVGSRRKWRGCRLVALNRRRRDRYFGRYRGKNGHTASNREPTLLTQSRHGKSNVQFRGIWPGFHLNAGTMHCLQVSDR
jgi:hypothetical protein